jgi:hypothetical protein
MMQSATQYQLCFRSLFQEGRGYAFPCTPDGQVDLDGMSERARNNYFYARAMIGKELSMPAVEQALH